MQLPRLDILLYAHDGRGIGHISRTVAIGMAVRRMFPRLRVLVVTGSAATGELIGRSPLDWLKLPSYKTEVYNGKSRGIDGNSGFSDRELANLREKTMQQIVLRYHPRVVLADHSPQGKHRELVAALEATASGDTVWLLGVRGVMGAVPQVGSETARQLFSKYYQEIFWYGDSRVLTGDHLQWLQKQYGVRPKECGYVSRLQELLPLQAEEVSGPPLAGTVALPRLGENSDRLLRCLAETLVRINPEKGVWHLFADLDPDQHGRIISSLRSLPHCRLLPTGQGYMESLLQSKTALIYGGYNSLTDILAVGIPAVVLLRAMQDSEQQLHLTLLEQYTDGLLIPIDERNITVDSITSVLTTQLNRPKRNAAIDLTGAEQTARHLAEICRGT